MFSAGITKPRSGVLRMTEYDLAIIGWGAAGFAAAIKASASTFTITGTEGKSITD